MAWVFGSLLITWQAHIKFRAPEFGLTQSPVELCEITILKSLQGRKVFLRIDQAGNRLLEKLSFYLRLRNRGGEMGREREAERLQGMHVVADLTVAAV